MGWRGGFPWCPMLRPWRRSDRRDPVPYTIDIPVVNNSLKYLVSSKVSEKLLALKTGWLVGVGGDDTSDAEACLAVLGVALNRCCGIHSCQHLQMKADMWGKYQTNYKIDREHRPCDARIHALVVMAREAPRATRWLERRMSDAMYLRRAGSVFECKNEICQIISPRI